MTENELRHFGIRGMKWGVRRYQNKNGTLTSAGKKRYSDDDSKNDNAKSKESNKGIDSKEKGLSNKQKTALKVGAAVVATGLAVYGGYKLNQMVKDRNMQIAVNKGRQEVQKIVAQRQRETEALLNAPRVGDELSRKVGYNVDADRIVDNYVNKAKSDNFAKALKNVAKDKISGGPKYVDATGETAATYIRKFKD